MERFVLTDAQWAQIEPHCLGKPTDPGRSGGNKLLALVGLVADTACLRFRHIDGTANRKGTARGGCR